MTGEILIISENTLASSRSFRFLSGGEFVP